MLAEKVKRLHESGMSYRKIAKELGETTGIVYGIIRRGYESKTSEEDSIRLRKEGLTYEEIANKLGIHPNTAWRNSRHVKIEPPLVGDRLAVKLYIQGFSETDISIIMGVKEQTVKQYLYRLGAIGSQVKREMCIALRMDGYYIDEVSNITGVSPNMVKHYTRDVEGLPKRRSSPVKSKLSAEEKKQKCIDLYRSGMSVDKISKSVGLGKNRVYVNLRGVLVKEVKKKPVKKPKKIKMKKEVKQTVSAIEQREVLGKGVEAGVYTTEVKLNPKRDEGRMVSVFYKEYGGTVNRVDIRVRDEVSDTEAGERWCKKFNREFLYTK